MKANEKKVKEAIRLQRKWLLESRGEAWAAEDIRRGHGCSARWGNVELDQAYDAEWRRLTGEKPKR